MKLYLIHNSLFHWCEYRSFYHCFYALKKDGYYHCGSWHKCNVKFPSVLGFGSRFNQYTYYTKSYFNKVYPNCPYIEL